MGPWETKREDILCQEEKVLQVASAWTSRLYLASIMFRDPMVTLGCALTLDYPCHSRTKHKQQNNNQGEQHKQEFKMHKDCVFFCRDLFPFPQGEVKKHKTPRSALLSQIVLQLRYRLLGIS